MQQRHHIFTKKVQGSAIQIKNMHNKSCEALTDPRNPIPGTATPIKSADMKKEIARVTPLRKSPRLSDKQRRNYETKTKVPPKQQLTRVKKEALGLHALCKHCSEAIQVRLADLYTGICGVQTTEVTDDGTYTDDIIPRTAIFVFMKTNPNPGEITFWLHQPSIETEKLPTQEELFIAASNAVSEISTGHQPDDSTKWLRRALPWKDIRESCFGGIRICLQNETPYHNHPDKTYFTVTVEPYSKRYADFLSKLQERAHEIINGPDENALKKLYGDLRKSEKKLISRLEAGGFGDYLGRMKDEFDRAIPMSPFKLICLILTDIENTKHHDYQHHRYVKVYLLFLKKFNDVLNEFANGETDAAEAWLARLHDVSFIETIFLVLINCSSHDAPGTKKALMSQDTLLFRYKAFLSNKP